jgi:outer membrane lipoprotein-sorting protein
MLHVRSTATLVCLSATLLFTGCVARTKVFRPGSPKPLLVATEEELVQRLVQRYNSIKSFNATVDLTPALGSVYKGKITEYQDISGYVLYRQSTDIRVIGLAPVVRTKLFDMVSTGADFRISIPSKNRFIEGRNDAPPVSQSSLENLRPQAFLEAAVIRPPDLADETPLLVDNTDSHEAVYILTLVRVTPERKVIPLRSIFFDRTNLMVVRQKRYSGNGDMIGDTYYHDFDVFNGILFPKTIEINRPKDGYGVVINVRTLEMNKDIANDKFVLEQPEGSQLQVIGPSK